MEENRLALNASKTRVHILRPSRSKAPSPPSLFLQGAALVETEEELKWLGVRIDQNLSFGSFVLSKCRMTYQQLRMVRFLSSSLDQSSRQLLINALVVSRLVYCDSLLVAATEALLAKVQRVWNAAARTVVGGRKYDHVTPLLEQLGWPTVRRRAWLKICRLVYFALNGRAPEYLQCERQVPVKALRSGENGAILLRVVVPGRVVERGCWKIVAARAWNSLPAELRVAGATSLGKALQALPRDLA
jgi:hypothetical protein